MDGIKIDSMKTRRIPLGSPSTFNTSISDNTAREFGFMSSNNVPASPGIPSMDFPVTSTSDFSIRSLFKPSSIEPASTNSNKRRIRSSILPIEEEPITTIYISNVDSNITIDELRYMLDQYGTIENIYHTPYTTESLAWKITFNDLSDAAIAFFDNYDRLTLERVIDEPAFWILDDLSTKELSIIFRIYRYRNISRDKHVYESYKWIVTYNNEEEANNAKVGIHDMKFGSKLLKVTIS